MVSDSSKCISLSEYSISSPASIVFLTITLLLFILPDHLLKFRLIFINKIIRRYDLYPATL